MSDKAVTKALKRRLEKRRLPSFDVPHGGDSAVAKALEAVSEHLRMYEGASGNPTQRFVTLEELKNAGLVTLGTKNGFSAITGVLGEDVPQAPSTNTSKVSQPTSGGSTGGGSTPGIDDRYLRADQTDTAQGLINFNAGWRSIEDVTIDRAVNAGRPELVLNAPESTYGRISYKEAGVAKTQLNLLATGGGTIFQIYDAENTAEIFLVADSTIEYKDNTIWHAGNDGPASGLNADLLDGFDSSDFARMANAETITAQWTFESDPDISGSFTNNIALTLHEETASDVALRLQTAGSNQMFFGLSDDNELYFGDATNFSVNGWKIWHENNDGSGSGLDADTVDGIEGTNMMTFAGAQVPDFQDLANFAAVGVSNGDVLVYDTTSGDFYPQSVAEILAGTTQSGAAGASLHSLADMDSNLVTRTKGDMIVVNNEATNLYDRLPVGSNDQVLTADSAEALGVKWAAPAIPDHGTLTGLGDDDHPQYTRHATAETVTGQWTFETQADFTGSFTANTPLILHEQTAANVAIRFQTVSSVQKFLGINNDGNLYFHDGQAVGSGDLIWHAGNDGSGSGLDADTVDGIEGTNMMTFTGAQVPDFQDLANFAAVGVSNGDILVYDTTSGDFYPQSIGEITAGTTQSGAGALTLHQLGDMDSNLVTRTKGDMIVVNNEATNLYDRLPVGTDGQVLTADSAEALGVKWAAAGGGVSDHGALTGLGDNDHPQYLLKEVTNIASGNLDVADETDNGLYGWTGTQPTTGSPGWNYGVVLSIDDGAQPIQLAFGNAGSGKLAVRRRDSGTYYAWTEFWSEANFDPTEYAALADDESITGNWRLWHGTASQVENLRVGRSSGQEMAFSVGDAHGELRYVQDETTGSHLFEFNHDSPTSDTKAFDWSDSGNIRVRFDVSDLYARFYDGMEVDIFDTTNTSRIYLRETGSQAQIRTDDNNIRFYAGETAGPYITTAGVLYAAGDQIIRHAEDATSGLSFIDYKGGSVASGSWYTIATNPSGLDITAAPTGAGGNRAWGRFLVMDQTGGNHQSLEITAGCNYGQYPYLQAKGTAYSGQTISNVRIVEASTYDGAALQVYCADPATIRVYLLENLQNYGWTLVTPVAEAPNGSWTTSVNVALDSKCFWGINAINHANGDRGEFTFDGTNVYNIGTTNARVGVSDGTNTVYMNYAGVYMNRPASYVSNTATGGDLRLRADTDFIFEDKSGGTAWLNLSDSAAIFTTTVDLETSLTIDDSISPSLIFEYSGTEYLSMGTYASYGFIDFGATNDFRFYDGATELVRINTSGLTTRQNADGIGLGNTSSTSKAGIGLYGSATNDPAYGIMFTGTAGMDTHGGVTDAWATFFTMNNDTERGWVFHNDVLGGVASITAGGVMYLDGELYVAGDTVGHFESVTGNYGSVQVSGAEGSSGSYAGYSIDGNWVLMSSSTTLCGLFNDTDNEWAWIARRNAELELYHNGNNVVETIADGIRRSAKGSYLFHDSSSYLSGNVTVSTGSPSGGANGDIWLKYTP